MFAKMLESLALTGLRQAGQGLDLSAWIGCMKMKEICSRVGVFLFSFLDMLLVVQNNNLGKRHQD